MNKVFYSDAKQDEFAANILNFKKDGYSVDIGSCHSIISNNTFTFQELDWTSISVEINSQYNNSYYTRKKGTHYNEDALQINYKEIFEENEFPNIIDYLSLDVDTLSLSVLKILPFSDYKFRVITIEHDAYLYGDKYRSKQREILNELGYHLICSNVLVPNPQHSGYNGEDCPFEDWWIHPSEFEKNLIEKIQSSDIQSADIIAKFQ
jgi:hypothetical protein